ncbi:fibrinogen silencer-binding protein-like [Spodoptera litura]|uniref:Regulatory protein zeste n=1 Tax=Spodoptera litura TaxID=69820 RepID=A0A9J7ENV9_SPOLT|nr:fibrinogen silencer-binding protein-like [Spodoptera litura]
MEIQYKKQIFTHQERLIFLEILKNYVKIVEHKGTHTAALKAKNKAWQRITMEFNMSPSTNYTRTAKQLRRLWMNLKHRQRYMIRRQQGRSITIPGPKVLQIAHALLSSVDSGDPETVIENVNNDLLVEAGTSRAESEETFNTGDQETLPETSVKIESLPSPTPSYETECENSTITPSNNAQNSFKESRPNLEDESMFPSAEEVRYLEVQLLKQKLRAHQQENKTKALHAEVIQNMEFKILKEKLREAKAKADLAELCLKRQQR